MKKENADFCIFAFLDHCRRFSFGSPFHNKALVNHVIKNITLGFGMRGSCRGRCTLDDNCVSYNVGPPIKDQVLCQLSDSDHIQHPKDLETLEGFVWVRWDISTAYDSILIFGFSWYFLFIYPFIKIRNLFIGFQTNPFELQTEALS